MVYQTAAGAFTTSGTTYAVGFDAEAWDTDAMHSTASEHLAPGRDDVGTLRPSASWRSPANATGVRSLDIRKNAAGNRPRARCWLSSRARRLGRRDDDPATIDLQMAAGDYVGCSARRPRAGR